jgi:hypothetical protein
MLTRVRHLCWFSLCLLTLGVATPWRASGQEVRGTVRDSISKLPVAGAVITLLDDHGGALARRLTDQLGQYRLTLPAEAVRVRFVRIGFRPLSRRLARSGAAADTLDVLMAAIPTMLEPVSVRANSTCPREKDEASAFGLLEQARATLLNTVVARESSPADMIRLVFVRSMDGTSDRITHQSVRVDSTTRAAASFNAVRSAAEFVRGGFAADTPDGAVFYTPDADVLLDDEFVAGYCFRLEKGNRDRPTEVGLAFAAPNRVRGRIDIDGVLWVDTTSRRLRQLEFRYVGLDRMFDAAKPGGVLSFRDLPSGVVIIDRWSERLPVVHADTNHRAPIAYAVRRWLEAQESGGEVARVAANTQPVWDAPLGTLRVQALTHTKQPAATTRIRLEDTDYSGHSDTTGEIVISRLLPGPYHLFVIDSQLAPLGITLSTPITFNAVRDSTHRATLDVPTADDYDYVRCKHDGSWKVLQRRVPTTVWMLGRVIDPDGDPVGGAIATVTRSDTVAGGGVDPLSPTASSIRTGTDGIFALCPTDFRVGDTVTVQLSRRDAPLIRFRRALTDSLTIFPLIRLRNRVPP